MKTSIYKISRLLVCSLIWADQRGQDLIEYAMIAGFIAVVSGMFMPDLSKDVSAICSRIRAW
jgi:Flp pilus assembly pilin Flp